MDFPNGLVDRHGRESFAGSKDLETVLLSNLADTFHQIRTTFYLTAIGFTGDPTARVIGSGGAQKKNS